jgi:hypothetical protein
MYAQIPIIQGLHGSAPQNGLEISAAAEGKPTALYGNEVCVYNPFQCTVKIVLIEGPTKCEINFLDFES